MRRSSVFLALSLVACNRREPVIEFQPSETLSAPTNVGTAPMFAVSSSGTQAVAWVSAPDGGKDGRLHVSANGAAPATLRDSLGPIEAHGESPPKIAYGRDGVLYVVYTVGKEVPGERFPMSALRVASSRDDGNTWSTPTTVTEGPAFGSHGFHALHVAGDGTLYVSWLGVNTPAGAAKTSLWEKSGAWITRSSDGGRTWSPSVRVAAGEACPCCRTALATGTDGSLYMAWRHVLPGNIRDVVVAKSSDNGVTWSQPIRVHADDWKFEGCPHAGPAIAVDESGTLHTVWWTGKPGSEGVYYAKSADGAKTFSPPVTLSGAPLPRAAHVQLTLATNGRVIAGWDDAATAEPRITIRESRDRGATFGVASYLSAAGEAATFPVLVVARDTVSVAWSQRTAAVAAAEEAAHPDMSNPKATMGLQPVGQARVVVRRGALR